MHLISNWHYSDLGFSLHVSLSSSNLLSLLYLQAKVFSFALVYQEHCDGIPAELFKTLKKMLWKCALNMSANLEDSTVATALQKVIFITISKKDNDKECSNYHTIAIISHASKVMLKILQVSLQQYMNWELPDVQAGFRNSRGNGDQIVNILGIIEKAKGFQKNIYFCFIDYAK